ncbi:MAG TPA: tetratricopeptide repeat protein [Candidatus Ozemobacteraceae bacterium]|nr:tetratricopeptide repeat protein [Candidatus Ozemobacteraceae bacterium]
MTRHPPMHAFILRSAAAGTLLSMLICAAPGAGEQLSFQDMAVRDASVRDIMTGSQARPRADTYYLMGLQAARKGEDQDALRAVETGLTIEPQNLKLRNLRAALWARTGRRGEAIAEFRRILAAVPDDTYAKESLRALLPRPVAPVVATSQVKKPARETAPTAPVVVQTGKKDGDKSKDLAAASQTRLLDSGYFEQARQKQQCEQVMASIKRAQDAYVQEHKDAKGKYDPKLLVDAKLLTAAPTCPEGGSFEWAGDGPTCSKHGAFATVQAEVKTVFADFNKAMQAKLGRSYPEALKGFEQVVIAYPRWSEAHFQLGDTLFRIGEDRQAIDRLRTCLQLDPGNPDASLLLANLYFKIGHKEASLKLLDSITKKLPGTVYGLAARSIAGSIRAGRNYYQIFPPN